LKYTKFCVYHGRCCTHFPWVQPSTSLASR
jgi:hypothetical protein